ncbi:aromatic amino acid lyase [Sesbania bispinosa]|nr:aromatic amino acid lyase [Sesbania bispinosa]
MGHMDTLNQLGNESPIERCRQVDKMINESSLESCGLDNEAQLNQLGTRCLEDGPRGYVGLGDACMENGSDAMPHGEFGLVDALLGGVHVGLTTHNCNPGMETGPDALPHREAGLVDALLGRAHVGLTTRNCKGQVADSDSSGHLILTIAFSEPRLCVLDEGKCGKQSEGTLVVMRVIDASVSQTEARQQGEFDGSHDMGADGLSRDIDGLTEIIESLPT